MIEALFVDGNDGACFRHTVALHDVHAEPQKRFTHLGVKGCAPGNKNMRTAAEDGADTGADLFIQESRKEGIKEREKAARLNGQPVFTAKAPVAAVHGPLKQKLNEFRLFSELILDFLVNLFVNPRHAHHHGRTDLL